MNNFKNKELYTIESCQQLEALEAVISNPEMPIKDILERSDCYYNPQHVDLIIALSHFLMNKDQAIKKSKNGFENWLIDAYTQLYTVETSPLGIVDFVEGMNAVRNNIGHGKYEIDPETLNVKIARPSLVVEYDWLRPLIDTYFVDNKKKTKELPLKTGFIRKTSNDEIDINDIEKIGEMYNVNEFNIDAKSKDFNSNSLLYIQSGINYLYTISSEEEFKNQVKNCQDVANLSNLTFDHKSYKMGDDLKKKLGETIENNYERLNRTNQEGLNTFMEGFMNDFYFDNTDVLMLDKAYSQIEKVARNINRATSENYNQLKQLIKGLPPTDNQMMLATILTKFNAIFGYNEDEIFKTYLDYSKLPMDNMQPTVCTDNAERAYNTQTNKIMALEKNVEKNYKGYLSKMQIPNKPEKLIANISNTNIDIYKGLFDILEQKEQIHEIRYGKNSAIEDKELYSKNKSIINHLRNAIAHGSIKINSRIKNGNISTCVITLTDHDKDGNTTFEQTMNLTELNRICNHRLVLAILNENDYYKEVSHELNGKSLNGYIDTYSLITVILVFVLGIVFLFLG